MLQSPHLIFTHLSLPPRGGWIEIHPSIRNRYMAMSLPPRGGWIEILTAIWSLIGRPGPSPHGEGGLK